MASFESAASAASAASGASTWLKNLVGEKGNKGLIEIIGSLTDDRGLGDVSVNMTIDQQKNQIIVASDLTQDIPEDSNSSNKIEESLFVGDTLMSNVFNVLHAPWSAFERFALNLSVFGVIPEETTIQRVIHKVITVDKLFNEAKMINAVLFMFVKKYSPTHDLYLLKQSDFLPNLEHFTNKLEIIFPKIIEKAQPTREEKIKIDAEIQTAPAEVKLTNRELAEIRKLAQEEQYTYAVNTFICEMEAVINTLNKLITKIKGVNDSTTSDSTMLDKINAFAQDLVNADKFNKDLDEIITAENEMDELKRIKENMNYIIDTEYKIIQQLLFQSTQIDPTEDFSKCSPSQLGKVPLKGRRGDLNEKPSELKPLFERSGEPRRGGHRTKTQRRIRKNPRVKSLKPKKNIYRRKTKSVYKKRATKKH